MAQERRVQAQLVVQSRVELVREIEATEVEEVVRLLLHVLLPALDGAVEHRIIHVIVVVVADCKLTAAVAASVVVLASAVVGVVSRGFHGGEGGE